MGRRSDISGILMFAGALSQQQGAEPIKGSDIIAEGCIIIIMAVIIIIINGTRSTTSLTS